MMTIMMVLIVVATNDADVVVNDDDGNEVSNRLVLKDQTFMRSTIIKFPTVVIGSQRHYIYKITSSLDNKRK